MTAPAAIHAGCWIVVMLNTDSARTTRVTMRPAQARRPAIRLPAEAPPRVPRNQASSTAILAASGILPMALASWAGSVRFTPGGGGKMVWPTPSTARIMSMPTITPSTAPRATRKIVRNIPSHS